MSNYANLKSAIQSVIKTNGNNEITGQLLQTELLAMINTLGYGYQFMGVASPDTVPGTPDAKVFYLAYTAGTYTNFGGIVVSGFCALKYDTNWTKEDIPIGGGAAFTLQEDDLQFAGGQGLKLMFANRINGVNIESGLDYFILRSDTGFAGQVTVGNTIYEIRYDFDLGGQSIQIPANCVLLFNGGKLSNGTLTGNNTKIQAGKETIFDDDIDFAGTWNVPDIFGSWFADILQPNRINVVFKLCNSGIHNNVYLENLGSDYPVSITNDVVHDEAIVIQDLEDIAIYLDGNIALANNNVPDYDIIRIYGCKDICIKGRGIIKGDRAGHDYTSHSGDGYATHEWGRGIHIMKSQNITVDGITVKETTGDGFNVSFGFAAFDDDREFTSHISFHNIVAYGCRRNGFVVGSANNILVENYRCEFTTMSGSAANVNPVSGIDIEPDPDDNEVAKDIILNNIHVKGGKWGISIIGVNSETHDINISNLYCENLTEALVHLNTCDSVHVKNIYSKASARCNYLIHGVYSDNIVVDNVVAAHQFLIVFNIVDGHFKISNLSLRHATNSGTLFTSNIIGDLDVSLKNAKGTFGRIFTTASGTYQSGKFVFVGCTLSTGATPEILNGAGVTFINSILSGLYGDIQLNGATVINSKVSFAATSKKVDVSGCIFSNYNKFVEDSVTYPTTQIAGVPAKGTLYFDGTVLKYSNGTAWVNVSA